MPESLELIRSPVTLSKNILLEEKLSCSLIVSVYEDFNISVEDYFKEIDSVKIYKCLDTGYRFYYPFSLSGNAELYEELQNRPGYYRLKLEHHTAKQFIKSNDEVLEIGCGSGCFLMSLKDEGIRCAGIEFNSAAVLTALDKGAKVSKQDIVSHAIENAGKYDVVCSFQVLEHISSVNEFISASLMALKKGGRLIIGVPNSNPFLYQFDKYHALNLPPHHMGLWDKQALQNLQLQFPIKMEKIIVEPLHEYEYGHYFSLLLEDLRSRSELLYLVSNFLLMKLRPGRLRYKLQKIASSFVEGRNILAVYTKL